jgi:hypothetical protein
VCQLDNPHSQTQLWVGLAVIATHNRQDWRLKLGELSLLHMVLVTCTCTICPRWCWWSQTKIIKLMEKLTNLKTFWPTFSTSNGIKPHVKNTYILELKIVSKYFQKYQRHQERKSFFFFFFNFRNYLQWSRPFVSAKQKKNSKKELEVQRQLKYLVRLVLSV